MVAEPYKLPAYISDLGGNDPSAHRSNPNEVIRVVRNFLHRSPGGGILPGPARMVEEFVRFRAELPEIARRIDFKPEEIGGLSDYRAYLWCVAEFLTSEPGTGD